MKPIIKETLQKKTTTSAKLRYLAYAYKEWLIAITLLWCSQVRSPIR